jgi:superfamily I DNA/RNA helicase
VITLNEEQQAAADAIDGTWVVVASPGSGKTTVALKRYENMLIRGIPSKDILNLTFTAAAAEEMVSRAGLLNAGKVFRTFHSYALELIKNERRHLPFKLCDTVIPVALEDYKLIFKLVESYKGIDNYQMLREMISGWKRCNMEPDQVIAESPNERLYLYALAYRDYERRCREEGWLDFDSLMRETVKLLETNGDVRNRYQRSYISVDEAQDTDITQFRMLQLIFAGNMFVVGDENQCQPPGTKIAVVRQRNQGRKKAMIEQVSIERLHPTDKLVSWDHRTKRLRICGRTFRRASRKYCGELIEIQTNGKVTKVTPDHHVWVKFNRKALAKKTHFVYLMWKKSAGFRIGTSSLRAASGSNQISHRGYQEQANAMWVLAVVKSNEEARTLEEIWSLKYGIPQTTFKPYTRRSQSQIDRIFHSVDPENGLRLLHDKGLDFRSPLVKWPFGKHQTKFHGYFKTITANVLSGLMDMPTRIPHKSSVVKTKRIQYRGPVYSLEVERDHTYIADGIPVGNCIYEWRSAQPGSLTNFERLFPGAKKLYLGENFRSTGELVSFFKAILPVDNGIASHMVTRNVMGEKPSFTRFFDDLTEASWIIDHLPDPPRTVILARTNRQLFIYQRLMSSRGIKYVFLGKKDFWDQKEIKQMLSLAKHYLDDPTPAHRVLSTVMREHNLPALFQRFNPDEADPIGNMNGLVKIAAEKGGNTKEFLDFVRKLMYGRKSTKKVKTVTLSTVHQAKGREWDHVFVIGVNEGRIPHSNGDINEERRIFFVACSRAAKTLHISYNGNRSMFLNDFVNEIKIHTTGAE